MSSGRQFQKIDENHPEVIYNRNRTAFYLRQAEGYSPEASLSDHSEELLWRSRLPVQFLFYFIFFTFNFVLGYSQLTIL